MRYIANNQSISKPPRFISGGFAEALIREGLTAPGNAAATAQHILASEQMYRFGLGAEIACGLNSEMTAIKIKNIKPIDIK